jgi:hypothetical protein
MSQTKLEADIKPFCPIHHWRMALNPRSVKASASYQCSFVQCNVRFAASLGYFEAPKEAASDAFLASLELVSCTHSREHHPCIVGYAKESQGQHTEEWRHWQCSAEQCDFTTRQKLSSAQAIAHVPQRPRISLHEFAPSRR